MRRFFYIVGYPLRLLMVFAVCLVDPSEWDSRGRILDYKKAWEK